MPTATSMGPIETARQANRRYVAQQAEHHVLVHAGVVAHGTVCVAIPGESESGKSTLVAGLVRAGWDYLSDELAVIDPADGLVRPYTRPISIDTGAYALFPELFGTYAADAEQWHVAPDDLRPGASFEQPAVLTHVVANRYVNGAATTSKRLRRAAAFHCLLENGVRLSTRPGEAFATLGRLATSVEAHTLESGELTEQIEFFGSLQ